MSTALTPAQEQQIKETVAKWDRSMSIDRACEELAELQIALYHYKRRRTCHRHDIYEELADVHIALRHLEFVFGGYQLELDEKVTKGNT